MAPRPGASLVLEGSYRAALVPRRLFGSFAEHTGRCLYGGIYELTTHRRRAGQSLTWAGSRELSRAHDVPS